jgi:hypothetical protein
VKRWKILAWMLVLVLGPAVMAQTPEVSQARRPTPQHRMGVHGMVLFGAGPRLYASHIPMFQRPHDRQLVLAVSLSHPELAAGRDFSDGTYTLEPERFDLDALADGRLKHFKATLYRGNFEAGGKVLHQDVTVRVEAVEQVRPLDAASEDGQPVRLTVQRELSFLVGPGFTPQEP